MMSHDAIPRRHATAQITTHTGRIVAFDLAAMTDDARASWLAVYELGAQDGWQRGYQAAENDMAARWARAHAIVQHAAKHDPYDKLAERRGDHVRAERQRALLRERGIA